MLTLIFALFSCADQQPEPLYLTEEFYEWSCLDYEHQTEITVTTDTCEDRESGLHYLVAQYHLYNGPAFKRHLTKTPNWEIDCVWQTEFSLIEEVCIEVEGVTVTAYIEPATWSGVLSGD